MYERVFWDMQLTKSALEYAVPGILLGKELYPFSTMQ